MHDKHHDHGSTSGEGNISDVVKLRKMAEHWIGHNEEHARSYRQWASRAREAGQEEPGDILEEIADGMIEQNERLKRVIYLIDSSEGLD